MNKSLKVAVVHEWLAGYAGSERVVEQMLQVFPQADLFALVDFLPTAQRAMLGGRAVHTSFLQNLPLARRFFRGYLPLMPLAVEQWDLSAYDIILSSSHAVAKGVLTKADQLHISYVHTPLRYAWDLSHEYLRQARLGWGPRGLLARALLHYLRLWDRASADRVDVFLANSRYVAQRIEKTYRRPSRVLYPPVDVHKVAAQTQKQDYYLAASRLVPYKRIDLIVEAFREMPDRKLVVIGDGPERKKIERRATANIELLGYLDDQALARHLERAKALVFAADEDFGILPVEAQAAGTPVICLGRGGATETVLDGETGIFFHEQSAAAIIQAVRQFEASGVSEDAASISRWADRFNNQRFREELAAVVAEEWERFSQGENRLPGITSRPSAALP
jgi:glycosyltransferase involved in cell wall biosynthesis